MSSDCASSEYGRNDPLSFPVYFLLLKITESRVSGLALHAC